MYLKKMILINKNFDYNWDNQDIQTVYVDSCPSSFWMRSKHIFVWEHEQSTNSCLLCEHSFLASSGTTFRYALEKSISHHIQKVLPKINDNQFPKEMKSYRELFLFSKKAVVYELVLNQIIFHSALGLTFLSYTFLTRKLFDKET